MNTRLQVEHPVTELVDRLSTWSSSSCWWPRARSCRSPRTTSSSTATPSRRASTPRTPSAGSCRRPARPTSCGGRPARGSTHALESGQVVSHVVRPDAGQGDRPRPRPRVGAPRACSPRSTRPPCSGSPPTSGSCACSPRPTSSATRPSTPPGSTVLRSLLPTPTTSPAPSPRGCRPCWPPTTATRARSGPTASGSSADPAPDPGRARPGRARRPCSRHWSTTYRVTQFSAENHVVRLEVAGRRVQAVVNATAHSGRGRGRGTAVRLRAPRSVRGRRRSRSARAASPRRCRAPCSRSTSRRGMLSRRVSGSAYWRR